MKAKEGGARWRVWLFIAAASLYLLTGSGHIQTIDAAQELSAAASLRTGNGFESSMRVGRLGGVRVGTDGVPYAAHDIGMTILFLPLTIVPGTTYDVHGRVCHPVGSTNCWASRAHVAPTDRLEMLGSFLTPLLGALLVLVVAELIVALGYDERTAVVTAALVALTTVVWVYSHLTFDSTAAALLVGIGALGVVRYRHSRRTAHLLLGAAGVGAAITVRSDAALLAAPLSLPLVTAAWEGRSHLRPLLRPVLAWILPIGAGLAVNGWFNWYRFGSVTYNGNLDDPLLKLTTPVTTGFFGQLLSPGKGMLGYSPLLVLALVGARRFFRRDPLIAATLAATVLTQLLVHAPLADWSGDEAWGARHTIPVIALCLLPAAPVVRELLRGSARRQKLLWLAGVLAALGFVVQLTGVLTDYNTIDAPKLSDGSFVSNDTRRFQAVPAAQALWRAVRRGEPVGVPTSPWPGIGRPVLDLWWLRYRAPLSAVCALLLAAGALTGAWRLREAVRAPAA